VGGECLFPGDEPDVVQAAAQFPVLVHEQLRDDDEQGQLALQVESRKRCTAVGLAVEDGGGTNQQALVAFHRGEALVEAAGHHQVEAIAIVEQQHQMPDEGHLRPALGSHDEGVLVLGCLRLSHGP
jgi:hypothetical protein